MNNPLSLKFNIQKQINLSKKDVIKFKQKIKKVCFIIGLFMLFGLFLVYINHSLNTVATGGVIFFLSAAAFAYTSNQFYELSPVTPVMANKLIIMADDHHQIREYIANVNKLKRHVYQCEFKFLLAWSKTRSRRDALIRLSAITHT
ncbi:hypothetical protein [Methylomonas sp. AM2-LC]|uniref:hypothetical protein n=1 Tax=Methylomonas sp. AM2-LC TaxID=3153301 RepID=UPI0032672E07